MDRYYAYANVSRVNRKSNLEDNDRGVLGMAIYSIIRRSIHDGEKAA